MKINLHCKKSAPISRADFFMKKGESALVEM